MLCIISNKYQLIIFGLKYEFVYIHVLKKSLLMCLLPKDCESVKSWPCVAQCILYCYVIYCHLCRQQGRIQVGGPKIGKNMIFWRKTEIFHTKYPKIFRVSLRSARFLLSAPPLTWNPGSAPVSVTVICLYQIKIKTLPWLSTCPLKDTHQIIKHYFIIE